MSEPSPSIIPEREERLNAIIAEYLKRKDSGQNVDKDAMLKAYPDLAEGLQSYFQGEVMMGENALALAATKLISVPSDVRETLKPGAVQWDTASEFKSRRFGRYQILRPLGEGAMGSVYLALDTTLDRQVALKVPKAEGTSNSEFMARFTREAKAAAGLKHANICRVYDAGEYDGTAYITMDFIDGVPLSRFIGTEKLQSVDHILHMISIIAEAVGHAHSKGVIHRDLKPGNILIDTDFKPHVTDFGLARRSSGLTEESRITQEGLLIGTPAYMAPEQVKGEQSRVGPQSDIYSLGIILFELLTCRLPFEGKMPEMLAKVLRDDPPVPSRIRKDLTNDVDELCLKMLQKEPERRFASIEDMISALAEVRSKIHEDAATSKGVTAEPKTTIATRKILRPSFLRKSTIPAALVALIALIPIVYYVIFYLKSGNQLVTVHVDDEWLKLVGGEVTLMVDGNRHTISVPTKTDDPMTVTVTLGPHTFSVKHGDTVVHEPKTFQIERDGRKTLHISKDEIRLSDIVPLKEGNRAVASVAAVESPSVPLSMQSDPAENSTFTPMANAPANTSNANASTTDALALPLKGFAEIHGANADQLRGWADSLQKGYRPYWISVRANSTAPLFDSFATASADQGKWDLQLLDTEHAGDSESFEKTRFERRIAALSNFRNGNTEHFGTAIVWADGEPSQWWWGGQDSVVQMIQEGVQDQRDVGGLTEAWLPNAFVANDTIYHVFLTRQKSHQCQIEFNLSPDQLIAKTDEYRAKGWRLHIVSAVNYMPSPVYVAVYIDNPDGESWEFSPRLTIDEYRQKLMESDAKGGQPRCVASRETDGEVIYTAVWDAPTPVAAPFSTEAALRYQEAWARHLELPVEHTNSIGMKFRLIPPGEFLIGSTPEQIEAAKPGLYADVDQNRPERAHSEGPQRRVRISRPFYIGTTEVTQNSYSQVVGTNPSTFAEFGTQITKVERSQAPVEHLTWLECIEFCRRLSEMEQLDSVDLITPESTAAVSTDSYRLPTEAEWEFACRAGTTTLFWSGDAEDSLLKNAWYGANNSPNGPKNVATLTSNPFGLFDMHGNVWEWVHDGWLPNQYEILQQPIAIDPRSDAAEEGRRVIRGGDFFMNSAECRSACRDGYHAESAWDDVGFRVALSVESVRKLQSAEKSISVK